MQIDDIIMIKTDIENLHSYAYLILLWDHLQLMILTFLY